MKIKDMRIGSRLLIGFGVLVLFCVGYALFTIVQIEKLSGITADLYRSPFEVRRSIRDLHIAVLEAETLVGEILLDTDPESRRLDAAKIPALDEVTQKETALLFDRFLGDKQYLTEIKNLLADWRSFRGAIVLAALGGDRAGALRLHDERYHSFLERIEADIAYVKDFSSQKAQSFYESAMEARDGSILLSLAILGFMALAGVLLSVLIGLSITTPIRRILGAVRAIAVGDLGVELDAVAAGARADEVADLAASLKVMLESLRGYAALAARVASGDYSGDVLPLSDRDSLAASLSSMLGALRSFSSQSTRSAWARDGINGINEAARGDLAVEEFARRSLRFLAEYSGAKVGTFYSAVEGPGPGAAEGGAAGTGAAVAGSMRLVAGWAFTRRKRHLDLLAPGQGLAGQAALEGELISVDELPEDYLAVASTLGDSPPRNATVLPIMAEGGEGRFAVGLLELGFLSRPSDEVLDFLRASATTLSAGLVSARAREGMRRLLEETRRQAERLRQQQEELRVINEELERQTAALRLSEEELQAQQEELRVSNEELRERSQALETQRDAIARQNEELENARLAVQMKARDLEAASRYKSDFLSNMSHELRTPLNSILILSQLVAEGRDGTDEAKRLEYARTINAAGNELLTLINDILDLAKIESGKVELQSEDIGTAALAAEISVLFKPLAERKGLALSVERAADCPPSLRSDAMRLMQVVRNLVSNAVKFTEKGSVRIELSGPSGLRVPGADQPAAFRIAVTDSGIGIPKEKQDIVFEAFKQADGATSRKYGGTGLGLSISRELARILGGSLGLRSEEGAGSVFVLALPEAPLAGSPPRPGSPRSAPAPREPRGGRLADSSGAAPFLPDDRDAIAARRESGDRVLLVIEDDRDFARLLVERARERGFKCLAAGDGETGLALARERAPDAVILDIGLPGMDGWEVLDALKRDERTRHLPVHFMSGRDETMHALERGAIGYLAKPVTVESLNAAFERIAGATAGRPRRILVVEDDERQRKGIVELVSDPEIEIDEAASGAAALALLEPERYDCVILDLGLRDMSGIELLSRVRDKVGSGTPVVVYTGRDVGRDEELELKRLSESVIIKGARSPERLVDEVTLFLHKVESEMPPDRRRLLELSRASSLAGKKVLIVDDDMRNVFALTSVLEGEGLEVVVGQDGREGLERLAGNPDVALVLMDVMMPEMDGYEAIARIRADPARRLLPIIALTAKAMKGDREKSIEAGANDYLAKPVDLGKLLSLLRVWIR